MTGDLDGTQESREVTEAELQPQEILPPQEISETGLRIEHGGGTERGYLDRTDREFRLERRDEFLEPMDQVSRPIEPFRDPRETVHLVNPDFETGEPYQSNCADAARCFERTWRGHAEEAAGRAYELGHAGDQQQGLYVEGEPSAETEEWAGERLEDVAQPRDLRDRLEQVGPGSSAVVHSWWHDEDGHPHGHAYNVVNHEGCVLVVDAQTGEVLPYSSRTIRPGLGEDASHRVIAWDVRGDRIRV